jgi:DNA repair exonuclease SbcCD ATPase subunit
MKILNVHLENFASYKTLDFNFQDQGLTLIHGSTGSGKSTLMDAIPWVLFGVTAKNGKADEVCSWQGGVTRGLVDVDLLNSRRATVVRTRGRNSNDLYYSIWPEDPDELPKDVRGKDIPDTQRLINELLGFNADLYLAGAYYHEFSPSAQFFQTTAKNRRAITEQLADLSLATSLSLKAKSQLKLIDSELTQIESSIVSLTAEQRTLESTISQIAKSRDNWYHQNKKKLKDLEEKRDSFNSEKDKEIIELESKILSLLIKDHNYYIEESKKITASLPDQVVKCKHCGSSKNNEEYNQKKQTLSKLIQEQLKNDFLQREQDSLLLVLEQVKAQENTYQTQIYEVMSEVNPHTNALYSLEAKAHEAQQKLKEQTAKKEKAVHEQTDLDILQDVLAEFRGNIIENATLALETKTNGLLNNHFDAELRIELQVQDADKLEAIIYKDGNIATFTQLSKGQRCLLKLCFGIAVMKAAQQHHAIDFQQVFFDEALDGLDDTLKAKAYGLLENLAVDYNSLFIVEHSAYFKERFDNKVFVALTNGNSEIEQN